jgi:hypothetical protein
MLIVLVDGGLDVVIESGETLSYQDGTANVLRDTPVETADPEGYKPPLGAWVVGTPRAIEFDEDDNPILWEVQVRAEETVDKIVGGWMTVSENPPDHPMDTVVIAVRSTEAYLTTLHDRLYAFDNRLGIVPGTDIESDEES